MFVSEIVKEYISTMEKPLRMREGYKAETGFHTFGELADYNFLNSIGKGTLLCKRKKQRFIKKNKKARAEKW